MKISKSKTENMALNEKKCDRVHLQGIAIKKVKEFKYLGSIVQCNGAYSRKVERKA